jgi:hypothetical protein
MNPQTHIFVTNKNKEYHSDQYDGQSYEFPPGQKVAIPVEAARHMFGFGNPDKEETLVRLGRAMKVEGDGRDAKQFKPDADGPKWLANFVFTKAVVVEAPLDASTETSGKEAKALA